MQDNNHLGRPFGQPALALRAEPASGLVGSRFDQAQLLWPVYEFRPCDCHGRGTVLRYADGEWMPDDGEWDIAFISYGMGAPLALYVSLPYQRNILWKGKDGHWTEPNHNHPSSNPWHYMLRDGENAWGGDWGRDRHPNSRAGDAAMAKCGSINGCANGVGPSFEITDPYIVLGLLRVRETKEVVRVPTDFTCMYCGDVWKETLLASVDTHPKGGDAKQAPFMSGAVPQADAQPLPGASQ